MIKVFSYIILELSAFNIFMAQYLKKNVYQFTSKITLVFLLARLSNTLKATKNTNLLKTKCKY